MTYTYLTSVIIDEIYLQNQKDELIYYERQDNEGPKGSDYVKVG